MKSPSWTSHIMSENASSSWCCTMFTSDFLVAFDGRHLSNGSIREVSEANVKFVATWLKHWKRNNGENMKRVLLITFYQIWNVQKKDKPTMKGAVNQFLSFQKWTIYTWKLAIRMKVLVCENNSSGTSSPFIVTDCLGKFFTGIHSADSVSEKIT